MSVNQLLDSQRAPEKAFGRKAILKKIFGFGGHGTLEGLGMKGVWKMIGKIDIVHQLYTVVAN